MLARTIASMSFDKVSEASNGNANAGDKRPDAKATTASRQATITGGVERFASATIEKAIQRYTLYRRYLCTYSHKCNKIAICNLCNAKEQYYNTEVRNVDVQTINQILLFKGYL